MLSQLDAFSLLGPTVETDTINGPGGYSLQDNTNTFIGTNRHNDWVQFVYQTTNGGTSGVACIWQIDLTLPNQQGYNATGCASSGDLGNTDVNSGSPLCCVQGFELPGMLAMAGSDLGGSALAAVWPDLNGLEAGDNWNQASGSILGRQGLSGGVRQRNRGTDHLRRFELCHLWRIPDLPRRMPGSGLPGSRPAAQAQCVLHLAQRDCGEEQSAAGDRHSANASPKTILARWRSRGKGQRDRDEIGTLPIRLPATLQLIAATSGSNDPVPAASQHDLPHEDAANQGALDVAAARSAAASAIDLFITERPYLYRAEWDAAGDVVIAAPSDALPLVSSI